MSQSPFFPLEQRELTIRERSDWLRLARSDGIGPRTFLSLLTRYDSAGAALEAVPHLAKSRGRQLRLADADEIAREETALAAAGGSFIALCEPDYPPLLRLIDAPPPIIAMRGQRKSLARAKVAIVGARNASAAGLVMTERLTRDIARAGYVIVSGLARGIDAKAHQSALETGTIAVLAGGLGRIYPAEHEALLERLLEHGAAISEMPFGWEARGRDFPRRNRIVSGLSLGLVVVEAARRSGSLITARFAAEQGRQIFAVPGSPLDPRAEGPNDLLQEGATFCTKGEDVIEALASQSAARPGFAEPREHTGEQQELWDEVDILGEGFDGEIPFVSAIVDDEVDTELEVIALEPEAAEYMPVKSGDDLRTIILSLLSATPISIDELARAAESHAGAVQGVLLLLDLEGRIERHGAGLVSLR
ncbi:DNA-processing protein DprA [Beijerinckia mobilis]|uniref:DNA-processing protein DprA n=1 Tax=Beijerinckia mobilis TaxID=231434 RepID=UPI00068ABA6F|nr:DNA-processing protein DprA [Beijerinckia mobilis]